MWNKIRALDKTVDRIGYWPPAIHIVYGLIITAWSGLMAWLSSFGEIISQHGAFGYASVFLATFFVLSLAFAAIGFGANQFARRRHLATSDAAPEHTKSDRLAPPSEREEQALDKLTAFVNKHLLDTVYALKLFHIRVIENVCNDETVLHFAREGIFETGYRTISMRESYHALGDMGCSPPRIFTLEEMIDHVATIETNYAAFVKQITDMVARDGGEHDNAETSDARNEWRKRHNAMIKDFDEQIKPDRRFGKLYRPRRENRFGPHIHGSESLFTETDGAGP